MSEVILIDFPKTKEFELEVLNTWAFVKYVRTYIGSTSILLPDLLSQKRSVIWNLGRLDLKLLIWKWC